MEWLFVGLIVAVIVVAGLGFMLWMADMRSREQLQSRSGGENDVIEGKMENPRAADQALREREGREQSRASSLSPRITGPDR